MKHLLTKEQILLITEKAVDWNRSALGLLTGAVLSPLSWLTGSIKNGIKKNQLNTLAMQWGLEYVNALKAFDTNVEVQQTSGTDELETGVANTDDSTSKPEPTTQPDTQLSPENKTTYLNTLTKELTEITTVHNLIASMGKWVVINNEGGLKQLKADIEKNYNFTDETILKVLPHVKDDAVKNFNKYFDDINKFIDLILSADTANNFIASLKLNVNDKEKFKTLLGTKLSAFINIENIYKIAIESLKAKPQTQPVKPVQPATKPVQPAPTTESMIVEAKAFEIPKNVTELLSKEDLMKFKSTPDIKNKTLSKVNLKRLDTIKYEAQFILDKAKNDKNENVPELQKVWDLGIKNVNDYFQDVIDVDQVMSKVTANVDPETKDVITKQQENISSLQKMNITETFPVGEKFNANKLYAFDCNIIGQNNKADHIVLLMSPTSEFVEKLDNQTFFWFKLLGGYKWDEKTNKTIRVNVFSKLTQNKKIINNFEQVESAYYMSLRNLRATNKQSFVWVYSNTGKFFFNNDIIENVDSVKDKIEAYKKDKMDTTLVNLSNDANLFRLKINQRFVINDADVNANKFPGIQMKDLKADNGFDKAKTNHDKFINIIK